MNHLQDSSLRMFCIKKIASPSVVSTVFTPIKPKDAQLSLSVIKKNWMRSFQSDRMIKGWGDAINGLECADYVENQQEHRHY